MRFSCSANCPNVRPRLPSPRSAASSSVPGLVTATHIGGCRRRTVGVLLQEVVLDRPHLIESQLVGELHLLERVVVDGSLRLTGPRTRHGELVEESEFHERAFLGRAWLESPRSQRYSCSPRCLPTHRPSTKNTSLRRFRKRRGHSPIGS